MKQPPSFVDPQAARELQKYENPIASRELISEILAAAEGPLSHMTLCQRLGLDDPNAIEALRRRLIAMERDGQLVSNRKGAYAVVDKFDLVRGRVQGHRDGYGFVMPLGGGEDIYLTNRQMRKVFDGDEVLVRKGQTDFRGRIEGAIIEVIASPAKTLVGRLYSERGIHFLRADNPRIFQDILVAEDALGGAKTGQLIALEVVDHPFKNRFPSGRVVEILGEHLAPGVEIDVAIRSHNIPYLWPDDVAAQAAAINPQVQEADKLMRIDMRHLPLVTIDGEDARDFDDAVFCEKKRGGGWRLYVAIADVAHYVAVDSPLDREAQLRGNSVYFPDYVVPMLPEALSNGLCSLNPAVDRLCMICEMTISAAGKITGFVFYESVMHSKARLTYTQVGEMLKERSLKHSEIRTRFASVVPHLDELANLYAALRGARDERGAIDFETTETRIIFDAQRKIDKIVPVVRNDAHKLIEECMLAANVCAAKFLEELAVPALYRVHEPPKERKLELLKDFLSELGLSLRSYEDIKPADYQAIIQAVAHRPDASLIQTVLLRSMNQAVYSPENKGHFGLAYQAYTHFTSPIRRYPDLLTHRAIRSLIRSDRPSKRVRRHPDAPIVAAAQTYPYSVTDIVTLGEQCSLTERRADEATRDVVGWLKCEYLQSRVGEVFQGIVSAVVGFGLFVELSDLFVEGLVHISSLPQDYYHHQPAQHRLLGERTGRTFRLGDRLRVKVVRVSLDDRKVDFELVEHLGKSVPNAKFKRDKKPVGRAGSVANESVAKAQQAIAAEHLAKSSGNKKKKKKLSKSERAAKAKLAAHPAQRAAPSAEAEAAKQVKTRLNSQAGGKTAAMADKAIKQTTAELVNAAAVTVRKRPVSAVPVAAASKAADNKKKSTKTPTLKTSAAKASVGKTQSAAKPSVKKPGQAKTVPTDTAKSLSKKKPVAPANKPMAAQPKVKAKVKEEIKSPVATTKVTAKASSKAKSKSASGPKSAVGKPSSVAKKTAIDKKDAALKKSTGKQKVAATKPVADKKSGTLKTSAIKKPAAVKKAAPASAAKSPAAKARASSAKPVGRPSEKAIAKATGLKKPAGKVAKPVTKAKSSGKPKK